jgi:DNA repair exonuclease SbcCD ATPase subunit
MKVEIKDIVDFYNEYPEEIGNLYANTRYGYKKIEYADVTAYNSKVYEVILENKLSIKTSPEHLLWVNNNWKKVEDIEIGDFCFHKNGKSKVEKISLLDFKEDLYDLQIEEVNEFYANDIVSHNSTILDALTFVLFNRAFRKINKPQLVNSTNEKECLVEIEFSVNGRDYLVRRGIKPNVFDVEVDGNLLSREADDKANQKLLEENILKLNYRSFTQIVILGSSNFVPFMQLSAANRREVIEDLLDIRIFSAMNSLVKDKIRQRKEDIKLLEIKKENLKDKVEMQKNFIEDIEKRGKENILKRKEKLTSLQEEIKAYEKENTSIKEIISVNIEDQEKFSSSVNKLKKLNDLRGKMSQRVTCITKDHKFFTENSSCPTCSQDIDDTFRQNKIDELQGKAKEINEAYKELEKAIETEEEREKEFKILSQQILNLNHEISQNNTKISFNQKQIIEITEEIQKITEQLQNKNEENKKLENFQNSLQKTFDELASKKEEIGQYDFAYSLLKDDGVKTKIIKKYLPLINQQINRYLQMMDFYINFYLDEEFNETVRSPIHEDFSYSSFSEGEKARIDLALLFSWREVARAKNSVNCNILLFDEVFDSSLDGFGADEFLKIIKYVVKDTNVFVISHKTDLQDKFDVTIKFEKRKGFSFKTEI